MRTLRAFWLRMLRAGKANDEFEAELESHIAMHTEAGVRAGLSEDEARRRALIQLGGAEQVRQAYRERATMPWIESVFQDIRFSLRQMRKAPGFTLTAVLTLALGIGANAVIYTLVDSILLRPLPYPHQEQLVRVTGQNGPVAPKGWVRAMGASAHAFSGVAGYGPDAESNVSENDQPDRVFGSAITVNAPDVLGIHPALGRFFSPDDAVLGQDHDVVLNYGYWRQHFGGDPSVVGRQIRIDGVSRRIIGVMPAGVRFPYASTEFVIPVSFDPKDPREPWQIFNLQVFGRLADHIVPAQAQAELHQLRSVLIAQFPWRMPDIWASDMTVVPLLEAQTGDMRPRLLLLFGAVGLILLIACANVANLMLARSTARQREIAIRGALGASSRRLVRQLLSESIVLGLTAGLVGFGAAFASLRVFVGLLPADTPRINDISLHWSDFTFTVGASVVAGVLFGMIPAIRMASLNLLTTLRLGGRGLTGKSSGFGASTILVVAQIGLSVVVITAAGLLLHSLYKISQVDPGFRTDRIVTAEVSLDEGACREKGRCQSFFESLLTHAKEISGVESVALADRLPLGGLDYNYVFDAENHPRDAQQGALLAIGRTVSPGYFDVLGLHLLRGRLLDQQDATGSTHAVVINQRMAEHLWPNQDPIGKHLMDVDDEATPAIWKMDLASIIVGVVRNARDASLDSDFNDGVYLPISPIHERPVMFVLLRTHVSAPETAAGLRRAVAGIDSLVPVTRVRTLDDVVSTSVAAPRALAVLLLGFGALAVVIGAIGVYSLIAYIVSWRVPEFGLRLALGAQRWQIIVSVVRQSVLLAGAGCVAGLVGAVALSHVMRSFLFEVSAFDPITFFSVALLMGSVALIAAWVPARRAAAVDPIVALRAE